MTARFVLVHGLFTSRSMWRRQIDALEEAGFRVVAPDLPGHGARFDAFTLASAMATIDDAVDEARSFGDGPVILVGLSLGGYLTMEYVGRQPRAVDGLIAMACTTSPLRFGLRMYRTLTGVLGRFADGGIRLEYGYNRLLVGRVGAEDFVSGGPSVDSAYDAIDTVAGLQPLRSIAAASAAGLPMWFVSGQFDQMRIGERRFHEAAPHALRTIVPGSGHMVNLYDPSAVNRLLVAAGRATDEGSASARDGEGAGLLVK